MQVFSCNVIYYVLSIFVINAQVRLVRMRISLIVADG